MHDLLNEKISILSRECIYVSYDSHNSLNKDYINLIYTRIRDTSVCIVTYYGLDGRGSIPRRGKRFSLLHSFQTGSRANPASYTMGTGGSFPGGKAATA
jgi:hypothetical protein